jgi:hypothetical protein
VFFVVNNPNSDPDPISAFISEIRGKIRIPCFAKASAVAKTMA